MMHFTFFLFLSFRFFCLFRSLYFFAKQTEENKNQVRKNYKRVWIDYFVFSSFRVACVCLLILLICVHCLFRLVFSLLLLLFRFFFLCACVLIWLSLFRLLCSIHFFRSNTVQKFEKKNAHARQYLVENVRLKGN